ncbi:MAG: hypothetical protein ACOYNC_07795, partial [Bacteroidales bacterium]
WSIVSGTGGTVTTPSSPTSTFTGTAGSTYTLRWTISNSPCTASTDDVVITFNRNPTAAAAGNDQTDAATCGLTQVTLAANTPSVGTGAWSIVSGTGGTVTTPSSPTSTFTGTAGSTYTLRWTISNSPCTASTDDVVITFNRNPTAAAAGNDQTDAATCGLTQVTLAANTPSVGTGAWSIVSGTGGTVTTPSSPTSTFTGTAGSTYTLRWTISNSPCTASTDDVVITFNRNPTAAAAGNDQTDAATCGLTQVTLAANTPSVGTGAWSIVSGTGGTVTTPSSPTSTFTGTAGSTYTLRWTISNSPCTASTDDVVITFNRNPTAAAAGNDQTDAATCGLTQVTLAANTPSVGTGAWSIVSGTGGTVTTPSSPTSTFTGTAGSTYTLRWTISNSPCTASTDDVVVTFNKTSVGGTASAASTSICSGIGTTVSVSGYTGTIQWQQSANGSTGWDNVTGGSGGTAATYTTPNLSSTTYYRAVLTSGVCSSDNSTTATVTVTANQWQGPAAGDWEVAGNWCGGVPTINTDVEIPEATVVTVTSATGTPDKCKNLTINGGLIIGAGKALTVSGTLANNSGTSGLIIENGGSLIHNTSGVAATVKHVISGSPTLTALKYHFVSIPTQYAAPTTELFMGSYLYDLDPTQMAGSGYGKWIAAGTSTATPLATNKGYMIYYPGDSHEYTFTGNLNNGNYSYSLTGHGAGFDTYNMIPNPYPSSVVWNTEGNGWTTSAGIGGTCYIWNAANGNYAYIVSSETSVIPAGQALMVLVRDQASPTLSVNNTARVHSDLPFYKTTGVENQLTLKATANNYADETVIHFAADATEGFDLQTDGMKLQGLEDAPQLYTVSAGKKFSISNLPLFAEQTSVPLNFETKYSGEITIACSQLESFPANISIKLEDKLTGLMTNLRQQPSYIFAHQEGNAADRFILHFGGATGVEETGKAPGNIWIFNSTVNIYAPAMAGDQALVEIFNTAGQVVFSKQVMLSELTRIPVSLNGIAVVRVTTSKEVIVKKGYFR